MANRIGCFLGWKDGCAARCLLDQRVADHAGGEAVGHAGDDHDEAEGLDEHAVFGS